MKIVFVSNYYNHHQAPLSEELFSMTNGQYRFIQTQPISAERVNLGWGEQLPEFVMLSYNDYNDCLKTINDADVVIAGSAPNSILAQRLKAKKLVLRYSERIYKNLKTELQMPLRYIKYHTYNYGDRNVYLLCASAFAASDYARTHNYIGKSFKWGYFPETKKYPQLNELIKSKVPHSLIWVARLIDLKHPEIPIEIAKRLKNERINFNLTIIGTGEMENALKKKAEYYGLSDSVRFLGSMSPQKVREYMEKSEIFLFTSDRNEGWGAVLNEAMNSACGVIASNAIGSVPYLIKDGINGYQYQNGNIDELYEKVKRLLNSPEIREKMAKEAYKTIAEEWNAHIAAERLIYISERILSGKQPDKYSDGILSKA